MISVLVVFILLICLLIKNVLQKKKPARWLYVSLSVCVIYLFSMKYLGGIYTVPSASMEPTLDVGDYIVGVRIGGLLDNGDIHRGDIVSFNAPSVPRTIYIKRVMGVPGDIVEYHQDKQFTVNGKTVGTLVSQTDHLMVFSDNAERTSQRYEFVLDKTTPFLQSKDKWVIPADYYFMIGDNRDHSWDSRYWENPPGTPKPLRGLVKKDQMQSRYIKTLFNLKLFDTYDPLETELRIIRDNDD